MAAKLIQTTLSVKDQTVAMTVDLTVQGASHLIQCTAPASALLTRAVADGRADWNTEDCADEAAHLTGVSVTL